ncbi:hypothetical protein MTP04_06580 [Lysinibacillus sp. PLM2]|nr:hypothetical protein MTP04_06580 [Lysinibacillus sp. PLM2]
MNVIRLLYNYKEIKKYFKDVRRGKLDVYDFHTMEFFLRKKEYILSTEELHIMLQTIRDHSKHSESIDTSFRNSFSLMIAILSIFITAFISIYIVFADYLIKNGQAVFINYLNFIFYLSTIFTLIYIAIISYDFFSRLIKNQKFKKIEEIIKICIFITEQKTKNKSNSTQKKERVVQITLQIQKQKKSFNLRKNMRAN